MLEIRDGFNEYLEESDIIDLNNPRIRNLAEQISLESSGAIDIIGRTFEYVRDRINHSADIASLAVTSKASEVLSEQEGICYAKAHLLAALLRANKIPCGFCYQRVILSENDHTLILHGLNAVYIEEIDRWIRIDASGLKSGRMVEFSVDKELLSFDIREEIGEEDIPIVYSKPDPNVIDKLMNHDKVSDLFADLPKKIARG